MFHIFQTSFWKKVKVKNSKFKCILLFQKIENLFLLFNKSYHYIGGSYVNNWISIAFRRWYHENKLIVIFDVRIIYLLYLYSWHYIEWLVSCILTSIKYAIRLNTHDNSQRIIAHGITVHTITLPLHFTYKTNFPIKYLLAIVLIKWIIAPRIL